VVFYALAFVLALSARRVSKSYFVHRNGRWPCWRSVACREFLLAEYGRIFWFGTMLLIGVRSLGNILDGMVAIESKRASPIGELFNEVPDRISDAAMLIGLGFAKGGDPYLGCLAALAAVFTAYVRAIGKVAGAPQDYRGPMAKPQRMLVVVVVCILGFSAPGLLEIHFEHIDLAVPGVALLIVIIGCVVNHCAALAWRRLDPAEPNLMNPLARDRLFGFEHAFDHPVTLIVTLGLAILLGGVPLLFMAMRRRMSPDLYRELRRRYFSWLILAPVLLVPILLGAAWTIAGVGILSLFCYRNTRGRRDYFATERSASSLSSASSSLRSRNWITGMDSSSP